MNDAHLYVVAMPGHGILDDLPVHASIAAKLVSWENGYWESFNSKLRDQFLNGELFYSMKELRVLAERWRVHYNTVRPHSSLGYRPPAPEAWLTSTSWQHRSVLRGRCATLTPHWYKTSGNSESEGAVDLSNDPRWELVQQIVSSPLFAKSERLSGFLRFVCKMWVGG